MVVCRNECLQKKFTDAEGRCARPMVVRNDRTWLLIDFCKIYVRDPRGSAHHEKTQSVLDVSEH